ncbi:hypothetical protein D3C73_1016540 [compost metagenome]
MEPLVDHEKHQQARTATQHQGDQRRVEPVQTRALHQAQYQQHQRRQAEHQADAVELCEALQPQGILWQPPADHRHRRQAVRHDLPERPVPAHLLHPERGQRGAHARPEGGGQCVGGQAVQLDARRQEAQRHAHQQRRQRATAQALQRAQHQKRLQVGRQRAQHAQHHEAADHRQREAAQREGGRAPRCERHRADRHRAVQRHDPAAVIDAETHRPADVGQCDLGDVLVEARHQHRQQHTAQPYQDAPVEPGCSDGTGRCRRRQYGGRRAHCRLPIRAVHGICEVIGLRSVKLSGAQSRKAVACKKWRVRHRRRASGARLQAISGGPPRPNRTSP